MESRHRWTRLSHLLSAMERALEGAGRLDAYDRVIVDPAAKRARQANRLRFDTRLRAIEDRIDREVDRLTVELLDAQLARKRSSDQGTRD